jgi:hypothetical protein
LLIKRSACIFWLLSKWMRRCHRVNSAEYYKRQLKFDALPQSCTCSPSMTGYGQLTVTFLFWSWPHITVV